MWQKDRSDIGVVLEQIPLGVAQLRPENLVEIGQLHVD
jgi:hypothetical protein